MMREKELVEMIDLLQADVLRRWVELGWIVPKPSREGGLFEDAEVARVRLICDLVYDLEVGEESVPVILSLLDQLHDARRTLKALAAVIDEQPDDIRRDVAKRARVALGLDR
jgi:chaperone modulatory protein CbpM